MPTRWLIGVFFLASLLDAQGTSAPRTEAPHPEALHPDLLHQFNSSVEAMVQRVAPSVVEVRVTGYGPVEEDRRGGEAGLIIGKQRTLGSGVIVDASGYIVTNAHVVSGAHRVQIILPARGEFRGRTLDAKVVGVTKDIDLALLKVDARDLPVIPIADSANTKQGAIVFAFGSPQGLRSSVTMGVVSAVSRQHEPESPMIYVQTDAPINSGNSGGPLVDVEGKLVGINTFIVTEGGGSEGLGFAIPGSVVSFAIAQLRKYGEVRRVEMGASLQNITPPLAQGLGLSRDWGVIVSDVATGSTAEKAGLKIQDVIVSADGTAVENLPAFGTAMYMHHPGDHMKIAVLRGEKGLTFDIPLVQAPPAKDALADLVEPEKGLIRKLGVLAVEIDGRSQKLLPDSRGPGIVVAAKAAGFGPSNNPLVASDVIHSVNKVPVTSIESMRAILDRLPPDSSVVLHVEREGKLLYVVCQVE